MPFNTQTPAILKQANHWRVVRFEAWPDVPQVSYTVYSYLDGEQVDGATVQVQDAARLESLVVLWMQIEAEIAADAMARGLIPANAEYAPPEIADPPAPDAPPASA
jgi:hypothetical protein